jgi:hypothetical protein
MCRIKKQTNTQVLMNLIAKKQTNSVQRRVAVVKWLRQETRDR